MKTILGLAAGAALVAFAAPSLAQTVYTTTTVNMRAGPGLNYPVVLYVPGNAPLQSYGCLNDWSWCDVTFNGYRGWMAGDYMGYVYQNSWVPVYEYGPRYNVPIISFNFGSYWDEHYRNRPWYSQRTRWESYDREHHDDRYTPQHRAMPSVMPRSVDTGHDYRPGRDRNDMPNRDTHTGGVQHQGGPSTAGVDRGHDNDRNRANTNTNVGKNNDKGGRNKDGDRNNDRDRKDDRNDNNDKHND